jgi:hypothetical protein
VAGSSRSCARPSVPRGRCRSRSAPRRCSHELDAHSPACSRPTRATT